MDKVSVIVPVYNVEAYLPDCIDSVLNQSYGDLEIVLVNDGSTDGCADICRRAAERDARVVFIDRTNSGVSMARNAGLDACSGRWVTFVDSDDKIQPHFIKHMVEKAEESGCDLVISGCRGEHQKWEPVPATIDHSKYYSHILSSKVNLGFVCSKLYSREIIENAHLRFEKNVNWAEDVLFLNEYLIYSQKAALIGYSEYLYTDRPGSGVKKIHPVENEYAGYMAAKKLLPRMVESMGREVARRFSPEQYIKRTVQAVFADRSFSEKTKRIEFLRNFEFDRRFVTLRGNGIRERIFSLLVKWRCWRMLDMMMKNNDSVFLR